jgi:hypothetical protein
MRAVNAADGNRRAEAERRRARAKRVRTLAQWAASFPDGRRDRQALLLGGAPAAQASVWEQAMVEATGIPQPHWFVVGGDDFQDETLESLLEDQPFLSPEELTGRRLLSTLQLAPLLRDELVALRQDAIHESVGQGRNLVVSGALEDPEPAAELLLRLERAEYTVRIAAVDGPSLCLKVAYQLAEAHGCVTELSAFQLAFDEGGPPELLERRGRSAPGGMLLDHEAYSAIATGLPPVNLQPAVQSLAAARPRARREPQRRPEHGLGR